MRLACASVCNSALRITLAVLPVAMLASGCDATGTGAPGASGPITVAVVPGIENAPLRVAVQDGLDGRGSERRRHGSDFFKAGD